MRSASGCGKPSAPCKTPSRDGTLPIESGASAAGCIDRRGVVIRRASDFSLEGPIRRHWQFPSQWQPPITQLQKQGAAAWIVAHARSHARSRAPLFPPFSPLGLSTTCLPVACMLFAPVIGFVRLACALSTTVVLVRLSRLKARPASARPAPDHTDHTAPMISGLRLGPELASEKDFVLEGLSRKPSACPNSPGPALPWIRQKFVQTPCQTLVHVPG